MRYRAGVFFAGLVTALVLTIVSPVSAKTYQTINPLVQTTFSKQVLASTEVLNVAENYVVIKEQKSFGNYTVTVIDRAAGKTAGTYSLLLPGFGWDSWNYSKDRYFIVRRLINQEGKRYYNYRVDILTGKIDYLPTTSADSEIITPPQSLWFRGLDLKPLETVVPQGETFGVLIRDIDKYLICNIKTRVSYELGRIDQIKPFGWSPGGKYYAYVHNNRLMLFMPESMKAITVSLVNVNSDGEKAVTGSEAQSDENSPVFLAWTPDGKSIFFAQNGKLALYKIDGTYQVLGEFNPVTEGPPENPEAVQWNPLGNKAAIQDQTNRMYIYDLVTGDVKIVNKLKSDMPGTYGAGLMDVFWKSDGTDIQFLSYRSMGKMQFINDDLFIAHNNSFSQVDLKGADSLSYYKGYLLFLTDIEMMGTADKFAHGLGIYDFEAGKLFTIPNVGRYEVIEGNKLLVYKDFFEQDGRPFLVDEKNWRISKVVPLPVPMGFDVTVNGKKISMVQYKNGTSKIISYDLNSGQMETLLSLTKKEQAYFDSDKNIETIYIPARKTIYLYNGSNLLNIKTAGILTSGLFYSPHIMIDNSQYYFMENVGGKTYFKMGKVKW